MTFLTRKSSFEPLPNNHEVRLLWRSTTCFRTAVMCSTTSVNQDPRPNDAMVLKNFEVIHTACACLTTSALYGPICAATDCEAVSLNTNLRHGASLATLLHALTGHTNRPQPALLPSQHIPGPNRALDVHEHELHSPPAQHYPCLALSVSTEDPRRCRSQDGLSLTPLRIIIALSFE